MSSGMWFFMMPLCSYVACTVGLHSYAVTQPVLWVHAVVWLYSYSAYSMGLCSYAAHASMWLHRYIAHSLRLWLHGYAVTLLCGLYCGSTWLCSDMAMLLHGYAACSMGLHTYTAHLLQLCEVLHSYAVMLLHCPFHNYEVMWLYGS